MSDDLRARRIADNEHAFREVNERIEILADRLDQTAEFLCECADTGCVELLSVPVAIYEDVRDRGRRFIVAQGHERPEFERVIDQGPGWLIVEKIGQAGRIADASDPREP